jgi:hypothetical protein
MGYRKLKRYIIRSNSRMTSVCHTLRTSSDRKSLQKLPQTGPESATAIRKGKQRAIPKACICQMLESSYLTETNEGCSELSVSLTILHPEKASW